jgi:hypothetical protein
MKLSRYEALKAYAQMLNNLNVFHLESILADDFVYESQNVLQPLESKEKFLGYIVPKLKTIANANATVYAEMGIVFAYGKKQPCVVLAQKDKSNLVGLVFAKVEGNSLKRLDLCIIPRPETAERSGEYPT